MAYNLASNDKPVIDSWHGYKLSSTEAEIIIIGEQFGSTPGLVDLVIQATGRYRATVIDWSDTFIRVSAPVDSVIKNVSVSVFGTRKNEAQRAKFANRYDVNTNDPAATWTITDIATSDDQITASGTGLDAVEQVVLIDSDASVAYDSAFVEMDGDLIVEWPAAYSGTIERMRFISQSTDQISQEDGSYSPTALPLISGAVPVEISTLRGVDIFGLSFGTTEGTVELRKVGGAYQQADVLIGAWTNNSIRVIADPCSKYDSVRVTTAAASVAEAAIDVTTTSASVSCIFMDAEPGCDLRITVPDGGLTDANGLTIILDSGGTIGVAAPQLVVVSDTELLLDFDCLSGFAGLTVASIGSITTPAGQIYAAQMPHALPSPITIIE